MMTIVESGEGWCNKPNKSISNNTRKICALGSSLAATKLQILIESALERDFSLMEPTILMGYAMREKSENIRNLFPNIC